MAAMPPRHRYETAVCELCCCHLSFPLEHIISISITEFDDSHRQEVVIADWFRKK